MAGSLLEGFRSLDAATKDALADIDSPLLLAFGALSVAHNHCSTDRLSAEHITACLEAAGVATTKASISRALARAGNRVSTSAGLDGETLYRLMTRGEREIAPKLGGGDLAVVRFEGDTPRTARMRLGAVLAKLSGTVRICDPYYGLRTFDSLDYIPTSCAVHFLTARTNESGSKLQGALKDFKRERPQVDFRIASKPSELHDRYVLTTDQLLLVGHGLKDIGAKESFMVVIGKALGEGLIKQTRETLTLGGRPVRCSDVSAG